MVTLGDDIRPRCGNSKFHRGRNQITVTCREMLIIKSNQGMQAPLVSLANLFQTMLFSSLLRWCSKILLAVAVLAVIVSADTPCCAAGCGDKGALKYWALDTPNNECAETCLDPNTPFWPLLRAEWATLTGFKGKKATTPHPCASSGFSKYNRTDTLGKGPLRIVLQVPAGRAAAVDQ